MDIINSREVIRMAVSHTERQAKFEKESMRIYRLKLNIRTDADLIDSLEKQESKMGYIKAALREYIANHPEEPKPNE